MFHQAFPPFLAESDRSGTLEIKVNTTHLHNQMNYPDFSYKGLGAQLQKSGETFPTNPQRPRPGPPRRLAGLWAEPGRLLAGQRLLDDGLALLGVPARLALVGPVRRPADQRPPASEAARAVLLVLPARPAFLL